jgi:hypothetical protein
VGTASSAALTEAHRGRTLIDADATYTSLAQRFHEGAQCKATLLTEQFDFGAGRGEHGTSALPLRTADAEGRVTVATAKQPLDPKPGDTLVGVVSA